VFKACKLASLHAGKRLRRGLGFVAKEHLVVYAGRANAGGSVVADFDRL